MDRQEKHQQQKEKEREQKNKEERWPMRTCSKSHGSPSILFG